MLGANALPVRVALVLIGSGTVSAGTQLYFLSEGADRRPLLVGFAVLIAAVLASIVMWRRPMGNRLLVVGAAALWSPTVFALTGNWGRMHPVVAACALLTLLALAVAALRLRAGSDPWRLGAVALAIACVALATDRHLSVASLAPAPDEVALVAVVVGLLVLALLPDRPIRDAVAFALVLAFLALTGVALIVGVPYYVDAVVVPHRAIEHLLSGEAPYRVTDAQEALVRLGVPLEQGTRLEGGTFLRNLNYPGLAILAPAPFVALGLTDLRVLFLLEVLAIAVILWARTPRVWRTWLMAALVGNVVIFRQHVLAGADVLWALLALIAWLVRDRRVLSPVALGLAMAVRQPAWFLAPFYLLDVARVDGMREAVRRTAIVSVAFVLPQLPFLLTTPSEYLDGVFTPLIAPLVANGIGLVGWGIEGVLPLLPRAVYGAVTGVALILALGLCWKFHARLRPGLIALPLVPLFLAWRSLHNYFALLGVFALLGDILLAQPRPDTKGDPDAR